MLPAGMGWSSSVRAVQSAPAMVTRPLPWMLSMSSVTTASCPMTRSALVATFRSLTKRWARGRTSSRVRKETPRNTTICTMTGAAAAAAASAPRAPRANQIEVSPTVTASSTPKSTMAISQKRLMLINIPPLCREAWASESGTIIPQLPANSQQIICHLEKGLPILWDSGIMR